MSTERRATVSVAEQVRERRAASPAVGRFSATDLTFGLWGRLVMTVVVLVPFGFFLANVVTGGWIGVVVLALVGLPWALRDIWRRADRL